MKRYRPPSPMSTHPVCILVFAQRSLQHAVYSSSVLGAAIHITRTEACAIDALHEDTAAQVRHRRLDEQLLVEFQVRTSFRFYFCWFHCQSQRRSRAHWQLRSKLVLCFNLFLVCPVAVSHLSSVFQPVYFVACIPHRHCVQPCASPSLTHMLFSHDVPTSEPHARRTTS